MIFALLVSVFFWLAWTDPPRRARRLLNRKPRSVSTLMDGQAATLEGQLAPLGPATTDEAPPLLFRHVQLEVSFSKVGSDGVLSDGWKTRANSISAVPAQLVDPSGALLLYLESCFPVFEGEVTPVDWSNPTSEAETLAERTPDLDTRWPARLRVHNILAGDPIRVAGQVRADSSGTLRLVAPSPKHPLAIKRISS